MTRVQKKCLIGSMALHCTLGLSLIFGPAFFSHEPPAPPTLQVVPDADHITDDPTHGGSRAVVAPPPPLAPQQPPQQPVVQQPPAPRPEPPKEIERPEPPKIAKADPNAFDPKPNRPKTPQINTNLVVRRNDGKTSPKKPASNNDSARQIAALNSAIGHAISSINTSAGSITKIDIDPGPGEGGALSANYRDLVGSMYQSAWDPPNNPSSDSAIVRASVTISSDGRVVSTHVTEASGDSEVDASVKKTLNDVTYIAPFPKGATENQRTYIIKFDLKAKRSA
jgi:TonB family protein